MELCNLPEEKLLIEADMFNPPPPPQPNALPPAVANPFSVNLFENLQRLNLDVARIAPIHGRVVAMAALEWALGRGTDWDGR